jgi:hypothetical protein
VSPQSTHFQQQIVTALHSRSKAGLRLSRNQTPSGSASSASPQTIEAGILSVVTRAHMHRGSVSLFLFSAPYVNSVLKSTRAVARIR